MLKSFEGRSPRLHPTVRMAETAVAAGDVTAGAGVSFWYGAVARGDLAPISIGEKTNIQDNAVLHAGEGNPLRIGAGVTVGHAAILHGCTVGDGSVVGMGAILLNGCVVGRECLIAAGALVPQGAVIPPRSLAMGSPAKVVRPLREEEISALAANAREYAALSASLASPGGDPA